MISSNPPSAEDSASL